MRGQLREDVAQRFGAFLKAHGFHETYYDYSEKFFGNEILDFKSGEVMIRFIRDRSQVSIDLRKSAAPYQSIEMLLAKLGIFVPALQPGRFPESDWLFGVDQLVPEWSRLVALLG